MLKSNEASQLQIMTKVKFLALIKSILATKVKTPKKNKKSPPHEIIIHYQNNEQLKNIGNNDINNRIQLTYSVAQLIRKLNW